LGAGELRKELNIMYEFEICHVVTGDIELMYGYNSADAFRRKNYNPAEWDIIYKEYID
jgi:hypothetical protein